MTTSQQIRFRFYAAQTQASDRSKPVTFPYLGTNVAVAFPDGHCVPALDDVLRVVCKEES